MTSQSRGSCSLDFMSHTALPKRRFKIILGSVLPFVVQRELRYHTVFEPPCNLVPFYKNTSQPKVGCVFVQEKSNVAESTVMIILFRYDNAFLGDSLNA